MIETIRNSRGELVARTHDGRSYDEHQLDGPASTRVRVGYAILMAYSERVLLDDLTWGDPDRDWRRVEVFTCLVAARRRITMLGWSNLWACPWECETK